MHHTRMMNQVHQPVIIVIAVVRMLYDKTWQSSKWLLVMNEGDSFRLASILGRHHNKLAVFLLCQLSCQYANEPDQIRMVLLLRVARVLYVEWIVFEL
jgi:hypothetical protein